MSIVRSRILVEFSLKCAETLMGMTQLGVNQFGNCQVCSFTLGMNDSMPDKMLLFTKFLQRQRSYKV